MKICYFGFYNKNYSRNKILISGLLSQGVEVLECQSNKTGIAKYFDLYREHKKIKFSHDVLVVGFPGFQAILLAKIISKKPIILDAFVSMYDSMVLDRKKVNKWSIMALYYYLLDFLAFSFSDVVLFDTQTHVDFVISKYHLDKQKFKRIFLGADTSLFYPGVTQKSENFNVLFYGTYIPLQGIEYIVRAAKILENEKNIKFMLIGSGQEKKNILTLAKNLALSNVVFMENVSLKDLADCIRSADVCLGIFGNTEKAKRVIPNKVFEPVASRKPIITADTEAVRELFTEKDLFLVPIASPEAIAQTILLVRGNSKEAEDRAEKAFQTFQKNTMPEILGKELLHIAEQL